VNDAAAVYAAAAFHSFYETRFEPWVRLAAGWLDGDSDAAGDVVQAAMLDLWSQMRRAGDDAGSYLVIGNLDGWMHTACWRKVLKLRHRKAPYPVLPDDRDRLLWAAAAPDPAETASVRDEVARLLRQIHPDELAVFVQLADGHSLASIAGNGADAARLGASIRQIRQRLTSAQSPAPAPAEMDMLRRCATALPQLPSRQRQVFELALRGFRPARIAVELGIEPGAARANLHYATRAMSRLLGVAGNEIGGVIHDGRSAGKQGMRDRLRLSRALSALDQVHKEPAAAKMKAEAVLAEENGDEVASVAFRALGLAEREAGEAGTAEGYLRRAIEVADRAGSPYRAAEARISLVMVLADLGNTGAALAEGAQAAEVLTGVDAARLKTNMGLVYARTGRTGRALEAFDEAVPVLASARDSRFEAIALNSRGIVHGMAGRNRAARADFDRALHLAAQGEYLHLSAMLQTNLGWVARQTGDLPEALARLNAAVKQFAKHGKGGARSLPVDLADTLLAAGFTREAREVIARAIAEHERSGFRYNLAESHLMHARIALAAGDHAAASEAAETARVMFGQQKRPAWADLARSVEVAARYADGKLSAALLDQAVALAAQLGEAGWPMAPHETRLLAGRIAMDLGRREEAATLLAQVARHRSRGSAELRILGWHAQALRALAEGRTGAAEKALATGLKAHAENNAVLGATELRTHAASRGMDLAKLGLRLALERGDARAVLRWAETRRAANLRRRPVRPPDDQQLADDLAELRRVTAQIVEAATAAPDEGRRPTAQISRLNTERLRLEAAVRAQSLRARGTYAPDPPFSPAALAAALGPRVLVEFIRLGEDMHAISVADGVVRRHRLGSYSAVLKHLERLRFTMHSLSNPPGRDAVRQAVRDAYDHLRAELDKLLFDPVRHVVGRGPAAESGCEPGCEPASQRDLVIVPTGSLHALPWMELPTCKGRAVSVTPSARLWLAAAEDARKPARGAAIAGAPSTGSDRIALVAGPRPGRAEPEIAELVKRYPQATTLTGECATATATAAALDGAHLAHVAAHGNFRRDHPLFSSLETVDGPLYVYDLERLASTPELLVLSACESALSGMRPGDELMGLASAMFALGTKTLIAPVTQVNDTDAQELMLALHDCLSQGLAPASALAEASREFRISGFVCFGYGG
jgi:tetratricopeptide (TPR) repeat protein